MLIRVLYMIGIILTKILIPVNQSLNGNILLTEGSGANTKYYIQKGADTASKKSLEGANFYSKFIYNRVMNTVSGGYSKLSLAKSDFPVPPTNTEHIKPYYFLVGSTTQEISIGCSNPDDIIYTGADSVYYYYRVKTVWNAFPYSGIVFGIIQN